MEIFDLLMSRKDVTIDKTDKYNNTPLHLAFLDDNLGMLLLMQKCVGSWWRGMLIWRL